MLVGRKYTVVSIVVLMSGLNAFAATVATASATTQTAAAATITTAVKPTEESKKLSLDLGLSYSSNMYANDDVNHSASTALDITTAYKVTDRLTTTALATVVKENTQQKNLNMSNTTLRASYKTLEITPGLVWSNRLGVILPTNRESQLVDRLRLGTTLGTRLTLTKENVVLPFTLIGTVTVQRNFHEFETNANGSENNRYGLTEALSLDLNFTDEITLSTAGNYKTALSYDGTKKYSFETSMDLGYAITKAFNVSVGISNGGSALKANGVDSNISFLDKKSSELNIAMGYSY